MEQVIRERNAHRTAVPIVVLCLLGLGLELSRPASDLGWAIRSVSDALLYEKERHQEWGDYKGSKLNITERDIDIMVRTTIGEAALEPPLGKIAVAHVILNRARQNISWYGGNNVTNVAMHKAVVWKPNGRRVTVWQFEPWMARREYLWSIRTDSTLYQSVRKLVVGCINGTHPDPTDGATHFLEPNIVKSRTGGTLPKWAQGEGRRIGRHVFYKPHRPAV